MNVTKRDVLVLGALSMAALVAGWRVATTGEMLFALTLGGAFAALVIHIAEMGWRADRRAGGGRR